ncbi:unnamed protein product [Cladocopium goreaui]|uniref:Uncharacterized protein n=1 Tax=Cladocopium goreaui TaxID=2562237 RepID=A0A9P1BKS0_9DINO|nr:unnamed protein product [Cladocopium goreaui]
MSRLASSSTLLEGMEAVKFAKGDPSRKRGKEELEEMIRVKRERVEALRRKLSNQPSLTGPAPTEPGAPHVGQDNGKFNAGVADTCPETLATSSESGKSVFQDAQSRQQSMDFSPVGDTAPVLEAPQPVPPVAPSEKGDDPAPTTPEETAPGTPKRLRRYFKPKRGELKCSKDALAMYKTADGRKELQRLLKEHGDFGTLEIQIAKKNIKTEKKAQQGGWYSKGKMCDKAWEWARTHKRIRCNPVHGEEEINVILTETYELEDVNLEETNRSGSFQVEDEAGSLLESDLPSIGDTAPSGGDGGAPSQGTTAAAVVQGKSVMSFKDKRDELNKHYVQCTKLDVALNGMLQRAKSVVDPSAASEKPKGPRSSSAKGDGASKSSKSPKSSKGKAKTPKVPKVKKAHGKKKDPKTAEPTNGEQLPKMSSNKPGRRRRAYDEKISDMASYARSEKNLSNASRNLNGLIHRKNKTLGVRITSVLTPIRVSRRRRVQQRPWPVLHLADWLETGFKSPYAGFYFLGGLKLNNLVEVESLLSDFWEKHSSVEGNKPAIPSRTIPILVHGDEGRGQAKRPLLVVSFQPIIGWTGADNMYAPDGASLQCLMESMVENINKLYTEGFQVNLNGQCLTFYIQYLGCKGDWPWLRSCYRLETGYKSHRICHRCPAGDWYNFSASASIRSWPKDGEVDSPFKTGDKAAIRNIVPGGDDPYMIKIDIAHTYAICGYGKDDLASIIVFLSCRCLLFGGRKIEDQLDNAFQSFNNWCIVNKKTTSITSFDYQTLKITSLQEYPRGLGKGFDTALLGAWMGHFLGSLADDGVPDNYKELFRVMRWGLDATNGFFRTIYCGKLWLSRSEAIRAVEHGWNMLEAYGGCARLSSSLGWRLWYVRPKLHMMSHVVTHGGSKPYSPNTVQIPIPRYLILMGAKSRLGVCPGQRKRPMDPQPPESRTYFLLLLSLQHPNGV